MIAKVLGFLFFQATVLSATIVVNETPLMVIEGEDGKLHRPESVTFSPSGEYMLVCNSWGDSVNLYAKKECGGYEKSPSQQISGKKLFSYAHEVQYSPDGSFLGIVNRDSNSILFVEPFFSDPFATIEGSSSLLSNPTSLSFSPDGLVLVVANRTGKSPLTFYRREEGDRVRYSDRPFFTLNEGELKKQKISHAHGVAFSPDGSCVASLHKPFMGKSGDSALLILKREGDQFIQASLQRFARDKLHSIAFHPSCDYLAITNEATDVLIFARVSSSYDFVLIQTIPVDKGGQLEAAKGVAFSPDGKYLAITTMVPRVLLYELSEK